MTTTTSKGASSRYGLLFFATLYTFFFVGALFGWGPMQRLLEGSGAFHSKCNDNDVDVDVDVDTTSTSTTTTTCPAQSTTIININFIAVCTNTMTPLIGQAIDHYRAPTVATYFMAPCALIGSGLMVVAAFLQFDALYYVAFCLLGLATFTGSLLSVQVGLYFSGTMQVRVIMFLNALFDAGSVTYLLLWGLESFFGFNFFQVTVVYFCLALCQYSGAVYFWNVATPEKDMQGLDESQAFLQAKEHDETVMESLRDYQAAHMDNSREIQHMLMSYRSERTASPKPLATVYGSTEYDNGDKTTEPSEHVLLADRPPREQLLSTPFCMMTLFFSINMISTNWALTTAADFLASLGDTGKYLSLFTLLQPASILALPVVDATVQYGGFGAAFQMVNLLTFIYISIKLTVEDLNWQTIHFVLVAVVRCYLFAVSFSFLPRLLGPQVVGKATGIMYMVGGVSTKH